tara:strand:+ start:223 stop:669 length:447 start_codon:yes stop_codon:yes gene_type:complete
MENKWHKKVREKTIDYLEKEGYEYRSSHVKTGILPLYYREVSRSTMTSDVDIIALEHNKIKYIIEIQSSTRPKDIIGIIGAINISTIHAYEKIIYPLKDIVLYIITKPIIKGSKRKEQTKMIKERFQLTNGCLNDYKICTENEFQIIQ